MYGTVKVSAAPENQKYVAPALVQGTYRDE